MKKTLPLILFILTFAVTSFAQMMNSTEMAVLKLNSDYDEAVRKSDAKALTMIYADDYIYTDHDGKIYNKTQILEDYKAGNLKFDSARSQDVKVQLLGDAAVVTGRWDSKGSYKNQPFDAVYRYTIVFAKRGGRWQAVAEQSTTIENESDKAAMEKALMDKENMLWQFVKEKRFDEFAKSFCEDFRGVYASGITNKAEELNLVKTAVIERYSLSNMKITFPNNETGIVTYRADAKGMLMDKAFDDTFHISTVWVRRDGEWKIVMHTEAEAPAKMK